MADILLTFLAFRRGRSRKQSDGCKLRVLCPKRTNSVLVSPSPFAGCSNTVLTMVSAIPKQVEHCHLQECLHSRMTIGPTCKTLFPVS